MGRVGAATRAAVAVALASTREDGLTTRLIALLRASSLLMTALEAAWTVDAPDWLIGAGAVRDCVWADLHQVDPPPPRDVDLAFFDPANLAEEREREVHHALRELAPGIGWDATNQAAVHLWYPRVFGVDVDPLRSSADAVATWPETATAVGVRLMDDGELNVIAPFGLDDLFAPAWRHNPRRATSAHFRERLRDKQIAQRWPLVRIVDS